MTRITKMIMSTFLLCVLAFNVNAADDGGKLYVKDITIVPGETAFLSVQIDSHMDVSGFQFQMELPDGITFESWAVNQRCMPEGAGANNLISMQRFESCKLTLAAVLNYGAGATFTHSLGELVSISISASSTIPQGNYLVEVRGVDVSDPTGKDYDMPSTTFTITVGDATGIETLDKENDNVPIYDLLGRPRHEVSAGQAGIVNGRTIYRK